MYIIWDRDHSDPDGAQLLYATDDLQQAKAEFKKLDLDHPYDGGDIQLCVGRIDNDAFVELIRQHMLDDDTIFDALAMLRLRGVYTELYYNDGSDDNDDIDF